MEAAGSGKTPLEMQAQFGLPAERIVHRVKEILATENVWTQEEHTKFITRDLRRVKTQLIEQSKNFLDTDTAKAIIDTVKVMDSIINRQEKITEDQLTKITETQVTKMLQMIAMALEYATNKLAEEYPSLDKNVIEGIFNEGLARLQ